MKKLIALLMALVMVLGLCACGSSQSAAPAAGDAAASDDKVYNIKLGHSDTVDNLIHVSLLNFKAYVEEKSGGKVKVDIYASEQLGSNAEMAEMLQMGSLDAMMMPQGQLANYAPKSTPSACRSFSPATTRFTRCLTAKSARSWSRIWQTTT